jgi:hypothetical protein
VYANMKGLVVLLGLSGAIGLPSPARSESEPRAAERNEWYWDSPVNIHWDNHGSPLGKGMSVDQIAQLFDGLNVDMIQVSARSGYTTYPSKVGVPNPDLNGYDTMATWRKVTRRLGTRLWVYINVIDEPHLIDRHPEWRRVDAQGKESRVCNRPSADGSGYLEQMMIPMVQEIIERYHPDGFWFDGDWQIPVVCYCANCKAAWKQAVGKEDPPRDAKDPDWPRWVRLEQERLDGYKRKLAEAIHAAAPKCSYVSNWSWAISQRDPRTAPEFADTLSGDVGAGSSRGALYACRTACLMLSAQEHTPHDVMSAIYPKKVRSLPRMLQEGGLVMSSGSSWFLWVNRLTSDQFDHLRTCWRLVDARRDALGRTFSLNPVAVLLSETSWQQGLASPRPGPFDSPTPRNLAFALQDAWYGVDVVNEQTLHERIERYRVVVVANQPQVSPETLSVLTQFTERGGTLLVTDGGLHAGEKDSPGITELLGLSRVVRPAAGRQGLAVGQEAVPVRLGWTIKPHGAEVLARLAGSEAPVLTVRRLGQGKAACLALAGFPYPDEDGLALWLMRKLGIGPMIALSGDARQRHLVCSARRRGRQLVLHLSDLTTFVTEKQIEPNSSHEIDPVPPIPEVELQLPLAVRPEAVRAVPAATCVDWQHEQGVLRLVLRNFQTHAAVLIDGVAPNVLGFLPADIPGPPPRRLEIEPLLLFEDFDHDPPDQFPERLFWAGNTDAKTAIRVVPDPFGAKNRVLEFVDAPDARVGFVPYLVIQPDRLARGRARFSCDLCLHEGAKVNIELRDEGDGTRATGPSIQINEMGQVLAAGKHLATMPLDQPFHLAIEFALGLSPPTYELTVGAPGKPPERFENLAYAAPAFSRCTWLGIVSQATTRTRFYVDNVRLERLP